MKLARVRYRSAEAVAVIVRDHALLLDGLRTITDLVRQPDHLQKMQDLVTKLESYSASDFHAADGTLIPLSEVTLLAPVHRPGKIVALGRNYEEHAKEMGGPGGEEPAIFFKPPTSIIGPDEDIVLPAPDVAHNIHHEVEIALLIAKPGVRVSAERAYDLIGGYTILNDVSSRDLQAIDRKRGQPFDRAKAFDTFCPTGPVVVTKASFPNPENARLSLRIRKPDGTVETRQDSTTAMMILSIPRAIEHITKYMSLEPGDLIATGTPEGVGPIHPGDLIECEVDGIGVLRNPVVAFRP
jgi:2-keto-4-pentenoate hydratase/2-oxohepta-3-ene-1,7-dioic acid hydratase in catechol pathway